jgi:hypothetical protein
MKRVSYGNLIPSFILLACLTQPACGGDDGGDPTPMDAGQDAGRDGGMDAGDTGVIDAAVRLSDGEIMGILSGFNGVQVTVPAGVLNRTMNSAVRAYIQAVVAERNAALTRQAALVTSLMISTMSTTYSMQYTTEGSTQSAILNSQGAATFDAAFLDWQIQMQEDRLLKQLKDIMIPSATSDAVKAELTIVQNEITARVAQARSLRNPSDAGTQLDAGKTDGG